MHRNFALSCLLVLMLMFSLGCGGGSSNDAGPAVPTEFVTLNGSLRAPGQIESSLLGTMLQNTDSQVRDAFSAAQVFVNGTAYSVYTLNPISSNPQWTFRIPNVGKSADGKYRIEVTVGKVNLKALVHEDNKDSFTIDSASTAALMLADATGYSTRTLVASFPSFISDVEAQIIAAATLEATGLAGTTVQAASVTNALQAQKEFFAELGDINTTARLAYLRRSNDLDGDGVEDIKISPNLDGTRIRFFTNLSEQTSLLGDIESISAYSDERLIADFKESLTSAARTFAPAANNFALGLYFKKSAAADVYLKLFVRRIDMEQGEFKGVVVEYEFVNTEATAIMSGSKTFMLLGTTPADGAVEASNFISDGDTGPYVLSFVNIEVGLGCSTGDTRLVKAIDGKPELANLSYADQYLSGGGNYFANTSDALKAIYKDRGIEVGDVFSAYFPSIKNYALFKIKWIGADRITVDYIVNTAQNEPRF